MTDRKIRRKDCVRLSNKIIERCQLAIPTIVQIGDIRSNLFISLLEMLSHRLPPGIIPDPATPADEAHNIQTIINHLALDLINVDLSHISGAQVAAGDPRAIYNLLEIFCGLHKYLSSHEIDKWHLEESLTETEEELSSTSSTSDSPLQEQDDAAADAAVGNTVPATQAVPSSEAEKPPKTPSGRSSAGSGGARGSASASSARRSASRPSSSSLPLSGAPGSAGGSPARYRSTETPPLLPPPGRLTSSGSGTVTFTGSSPSSRTSSSGGSAAARSFPESDASLNADLPVSPPGGAGSGALPPDLPAGPPAAGQDTDGDQTAAADQEAAAADREDGQEAAQEQESGESGEPTTESAGQDSPTTETEETRSSELERLEVLDEQSPHETDDRAGGDEYKNLAYDADTDVETSASLDEDALSVDQEDGDEDEDMSRQLSEAMQQMQQAASSAAEQTSSAAKRQTSKQSPTTPTSSSDTTAGAASPPRGDPASRPGRSAPCGTAAAAAAGGSSRGRRRRSSDRSSVSDPGVSGRRPAGRPLLTRNIETIAEIHESGGERAVSRTTREQAGDKLCKQTVQREVRRKLHSAPHTTTRRMSYSKQSSGRSARSDGGVVRWLESQGDDTHFRVEGQEVDMFEFLRRELPYVHVSEETKRKLLLEYRRQVKYVMNLVQPVETRKYKIRRQDVLRRQALLTDVMRQQKQHDARLRQLCDARRQQIGQRNAQRDAKISCLRAQRYVDSFKQQFASRTALNKSREELLLKAVFEEMLEIQRHRLRTVRALEKRAIREFYGEDGYTSELNRMHQFYEANFRDLALMLSRERTELQISEKEQAKLADRIKRDFRDYMEADVRSLNDKIVNSWQPQYRELDADRIRSDLYEANWKFCVT